MQTICLDLDDFSVLRNRLDLLLQLKEHYPDLKLTAFTIPFDFELELTQLALTRDRQLKTIKENLDWIQLVPHGLTHIPNEFANADRKAMQLALKAIDEQFRKDGLPYEKGFKAPFWLWNSKVVKYLDQKGWWGAVDKNQPNMPTTKRFYRYTHSIDEPFWESNDEVLKLHGHMTAPSTNNLEDCFLNLMKMPRDATFVFATDLLEYK
jgi:hypothetical protein